jgi:hypothetical protein
VESHLEQRITHAEPKQRTKVWFRVCCALQSVCVRCGEIGVQYGVAHKFNTNIFSRFSGESSNRRMCFLIVNLRQVSALGDRGSGLTLHAFRNFVLDKETRMCKSMVIVFCIMAKVVRFA